MRGTADNPPDTSSDIFVDTSVNTSRLQHLHSLVRDPEWSFRRCHIETDVVDVDHFGEKGVTCFVTFKVTLHLTI